MPTFYLYAITDGPGLPLPELFGVDGGELSALNCGALQAVVSPLAGGGAPLSKARLLQHEAVVEALMRDRAVLPARFGTTADAGKIVAALDGRVPLFAAALERVRGRVEIGVRVLWPAPVAPPARPGEADRADGRAYMRALMAGAQRGREQREAAESFAAQLAAALADLADAETHEALAEPRPQLKAAFLVRRERVPEARRRIAAIGAARPELSVLATGPWPAYSFSNLQEPPR
jgi:hypothetical protein